MRLLEILPGIGVPPIRLGTTHDEVRGAMGEPESESSVVWEYLSAALLVNFDAGRVEYIEVSNAPDVQVGAIYKGQPIFELPMGEAARLVRGHDDGKPPNPCVDGDADIGLYSCDGERWDTIGVGSGDHFGRYR